MPLDSDGRKLHRFISKEMNENGIYKQGLTFVITQLVRSFQVWWNIDKMVVEKGEKVLIQTYENGVRQVSPEWTIWKESMTKCIELYAKLGLTPDTHYKIINVQNNILQGEIPFDDPYSAFAAPITING